MQLILRRVNWFSACYAISCETSRHQRISLLFHTSLNADKIEKYGNTERFDNFTDQVRPICQKVILLNTGQCDDTYAPLSSTPLPPIMLWPHNDVYNLERERRGGSSSEFPSIFSSLLFALFPNFRNWNNKMSFFDKLLFVCYWTQSTHNLSMLNSAYFDEKIEKYWIESIRECNTWENSK